MAQGLSRASLGPSGPGPQGPSAAMQLIQDMAVQNQQTLQKSQQRIVQMQQESDRQMQMQAQQMQSGVMDVANQVAAGIQGRREEQKQRAARVEDMRAQEDLMLFQQKIAEESAAEGRRIGLAMKQANEATMTEIQRWTAKGDQMKANHTAVVGAFNDMVSKGVFSNMQGGYQKMADIQRSLRMSEAYIEDHTDPSYISHATNLMQQAERDIAEGRDPMDLAAVYDRPTSSPYEGVTPTGKAVDNLDGQTRFSMMLRGGYPEEGIFALPVDDPRRDHVNVVTPDVMARLLVDNATMTGLISAESKNKFVQQRMKALYDADGKYQQYAQQYRQITDLMVGRAPAAVSMGAEAFVVDPSPEKWQNPGQTMFAHSLKAMFPEGGDQIMQLANGIRNRTVQLDTSMEFANAASLESAAFAIEARAIDALSTAQQSLPALVDQFYATHPEAAVQMWGDRTSDPASMVRAQAGMQKMLEGLKSYAGEVRQGANEVGALEGFRREFGTNSRLMDTYLYHYFTSKGEDKAKAEKMLYTDAAQAADRMSLEDLDRMSVEPTEEIQSYRNILDSTIEMVQQVGPSQMPKLAALLSGGQVDLTDGRIPAFNAATASIAERNVYVQLAVDALKDSKDLQKMARERASQGAPMSAEEVLMEKNRKNEMRGAKAKAYGQTYKETGAIGVGLRGAAAAPGVAVRGMSQGIQQVGQAGRSIGTAMGGQAYRDIIEYLAESMAPQFTPAAQDQPMGAR